MLAETARNVNGRDYGEMNTNQRALWIQLDHWIIDSPAECSTHVEPSHRPHISVASILLIFHCVLSAVQCR